MILYLLLLLGASCTNAVIASLEERLTFSVKEGLPRGTLVGRINKRSGITYRLNEDSPHFVFSPASGEIRTRTVLDREELASASGQDSFSSGSVSTEVDIIILGAKPSFFIFVRINVLDVNDNVPHFPFSHQNVSLPEGSQVAPQLQGSVVGGGSVSVWTATDPDVGDAGRIVAYDIVGGNEAGYFRLQTSAGDSSSGEDPRTLRLEAVRPLDREAQAEHVLNISARDGGGLTGYLTVYVAILDSNDNAPVFSVPPPVEQSSGLLQKGVFGPGQRKREWGVRLSEATPRGTPVMQLHATDTDLGDNGRVSYSLATGAGSQMAAMAAMFTVNSKTGWITTNTDGLTCPIEEGCSTERQLIGTARTKNCTYVCILAVEAHDHGQPEQRSRTYLRLELIDVNDHAPQISLRFNPPSAPYASVSPTSREGSLVAIISVADKDLGDNGATTLRISRGNGARVFRLDTNPLFTLLRLNRSLASGDTLELDEALLSDSFTIELEARDHGNPPKVTRKELTVYLDNEQDRRPPVFTDSLYSFVLSAEHFLVPGSFVGRVRATQPSSTGPIRTISYGLEPLPGLPNATSVGPIFRIHPRSGIITVVTAPELGLEPTPKQIEMIVTAAYRSKHAPALLSRASLRITPQGLAKYRDSFGCVGGSNNQGLSSTINLNPHTEIGDTVFQFQLANKMSTYPNYSNTEPTRNSLSIYRYKLSRQSDPMAFKMFTLDETSGHVFLVDKILANPPLTSVSVVADIYLVKSDASKPVRSCSMELKVSQTAEKFKSKKVKLYPREYWRTILRSTVTGSHIATIRKLAPGSEPDNPSLEQTISYVILKAPINSFTVDPESGRLSLKRIPFGRRSVDVTVGLRDVSSGSILPNNNATVHVLIVDSISALPECDVTPRSVDDSSHPMINRDDVMELKATRSRSVRRTTPGDHDASYVEQFDVTENDGDRGASFGSHEEVIGSLSCKDAIGSTSQVIYYLIDGDPEGRFHIGPYSGELRSVKALDRERMANADGVLLTAAVIGKHGSILVDIKINLLDINDNLPKFDNALSDELKIITILPTMPLGYPLLNVHATDADDDLNGRVVHSLVLPSSMGDFGVGIEPQTGILYLKRPGYNMTFGEHKLKVIATDGGQPKLSSTMELTLNVQSSKNTCQGAPCYSIGTKLPPTKIYLTIPENTIDNEVCSQNITGHLADLDFEIDSGKTSAQNNINIFPNGTLYIQCPLDYEEVRYAEQRLTTSTRSSESKTTPTAIQTTLIGLTVSDVNDNAPECAQSRFLFKLRENMPPLTYVGTVRASDADTGENGRLIYRLVSTRQPERQTNNRQQKRVDWQSDPASMFSIDPVSGRIVSLAAFDRELMAKQNRKARSNLPRDNSPIRLTFLVAVSDNGPDVRTTKCPVTIEILDVNDHFSVFSQHRYEMSLSEDRPVGSQIFGVHATDEDVGPAGLISYSIGTTLCLRHAPGGSNYDLQEPFAINETSGIVTLISGLDRESCDILTFNISAADDQLSTVVPAVITVTDVNDNPPIFDTNVPVTITVPEDEAVGSAFTVIRAHDPDLGTNGQLTFDLTAGNLGGCFQVNPDSGVLFLTKPLDREDITSYVLTIVARDNGLPSKSTERKLEIIVGDVNDNAPVVDPRGLIAEIAENLPAGTVVMTLEATDPDFMLNAALTFEIIAQVPAEAFSIDPNSGVLRTIHPLDREFTATYQVLVLVSNPSNPQTQNQSVEHLINVFVKDVNDMEPILTSGSAGLLAVRDPVGTRVTSLMAWDGDLGLNGTVGFRLAPTTNNAGFGESPAFYKSKPGSDASNFGIGLDGALYLKRPLPTPVEVLYRIQLEIMDRVQNDGRLGPVAVSNPDVFDDLKRLSTQAEFTVIVVDNSLPPMPGFRFEQNRYRFRTGSTTSPDWNRVARTDIRPTRIVELGSVRLAPTGVSTQLGVEYYIVGARVGGIDHPVYPFSMDRTTGVVRIAAGENGFALNLGTGRVELDVYAVATRGQRRATANCQVEIELDSTSEARDKLSEHFYTFHILEGAPIGTEVGRVHVASNELSPGLFRPLGGPASKRFALETDSGIIRNIGFLDREIDDEYGFKVFLSSWLDSAYVKVIVDDENDHAPVFTKDLYTFTLSAQSPKGTFIGAVSATDSDAGTNGTIRYQLLSSNVSGGPSAFVLDPHTGVLTLAGYVKNEDTVEVLEIQAVDQGVPSKASSVEVFIFLQQRDSDKTDLMEPQYRYKIRVPENQPVGSVLSTPELYSMLRNNEMLGTMTIGSGDPFGKFRLTSNGSIVLSQPLDYEIEQSYTLNVVRKHAPGQVIALVEIVVTDVNDNAPKFTTIAAKSHGRTDGPTEIHGVISEDALPGTRILTLTATDADSGPNGKLSYHLDPLAGNMFSLDPVFGYLSLKGRLDREHTDLHNVSVTVFDHGTPSLRSFAYLLIHVLDVNDHEPQLLNSDYVYLEVAENTPVGTSVLKLDVTDPDIGANAAVVFDIQGNDPGQHLTMDPQTNYLRIARPLDHEQTPLYNLSIDVNNILPTHESSSKARNARKKVVVNVTDVNDNVPQFLEPTPHLSLYENLFDIPALVGSVRAVDLDSGFNGKLSYSIIQGNTSVFSIDSLTGDIWVQMGLDRENQESYQLTVTATDSGVPRLIGSCHVVIEILDTNDNDPAFDQLYYDAEVEENLPANTFVATVTARDLDDGYNGMIRFHLLTRNTPFKVHPLTGDIVTTMPVDREEIDSYTLIISATDSGIERVLSTSVEVTVKVTDVNDNPPRITYPKGPEVVIPYHGSGIGEFLFITAASDADIGPNAMVSFSILGKHATNFNIDPTTGIVTNSRTLQLGRAYDINIWITSQTPQPSGKVDNASLPLKILVSTRSNFPIFNPELQIDEKSRHKRQNRNINNINNNANQTELSAIEGVANQHVATVGARSPKQPPFNRVSYAIVAANSDGAFFIDQIQGAIWTTARLDRERQAYYGLWISASDNDNPALTSFKPVSIRVLDTNDNAPQFTLPLYKGVIPEQSQREGRPSFILGVEATDPDIGANISYDIIRGNDEGAFSIDTATGDIFAMATLDREHLSEYWLTVRARDGPGLGATSHSAIAMVHIAVEDVNDNSPRFTRLMRAEVPEDAPVGTFVTRVTSFDLDDIGSGNQFSNNTYAFVSSDDDVSEFRIDPVAGEVFVAAELDRERISEYSLRVVASDGTWRVETTLSIAVTDINDNPPQFSRPLYDFHISEMQPAHTVVGSVVAMDMDDLSSNNISSGIHYSLAMSDVHFRIHPITAQIVSLVPLRYHEDNALANAYTLIIGATDSGEPKSLSAQVQASIQVVKRNKFQPVFEPADRSNTHPASWETTDIVLRISAGTKSGSVIMKFQLFDGDNDTVSLTLKPINPDRAVELTYFALNSTDATLSVGPRFSELRSGLRLTYLVTASDGGSPPMISTRKLIIHLVDTASITAPKFMPTSLDPTIELSENAAKGTLIHQFVAGAENGENLFAISKVTARRIEGGLSNVEQNYFKINPTSGQLTTNRGLDYEQVTGYNITITAVIFRKFPPKVSTSTLQLTIIDVNDNAPVFAANSVNPVTISEDSPVGSVIANVEATDSDASATYSEVKYEILDTVCKITTSLFGEYDTGFSHEVRKNVQYFTINSSTGSIQISNALDYEQYSQCELILRAYNPDNDLSSDSTLVINVSGVNKFPPVFSNPSYQFFANPAIGPGDIVGEVGANDRDEGVDGLVQYFLSPRDVASGFSVDPSSGLISVAHGFNPSLAHTTETMHLNVYARNPLDVNVRMTKADVLINFDVTAGKAKLPTWVESQKLSAVLAENAPISSVVFTVRAQNAARYALASVNGLSNDIGSLGSKVVEGIFGIDAFSGVVKTTSDIDYEKYAQFVLKIVAIGDSLSGAEEPLKIEQDFVVNVENLNDNPPRLDLSSMVGVITEGEPVGTAIAQLTAVDPDISSDDTLPPSFSFLLSPENGEALNNYFELEPTTGILRSGIIFDRETRARYDLLISISDNGRPRQTSTNNLVTILVGDANDNPPQNSSSVNVFVVKLNDPTKINNDHGDIAAQLKPRDPDRVGEYTCGLQRGAPIAIDGARLTEDCQLSIPSSFQPSRNNNGINGIELPTSRLISIMSTNQGYSNAVTFDAHLEFTEFSLEDIRTGLVQVEVSGTPARVFFGTHGFWNDLTTNIGQLPASKGVSAHIISIEEHRHKYGTAETDILEEHDPIRHYLISVLLDKSGFEGVIGSRLANEIIAKATSQSTSCKVINNVEDTLKDTDSCYVHQIYTTTCSNTEQGLCQNGGTCQVDVSLDDGKWETFDYPMSPNIFTFRRIHRRPQCQCVGSFTGSHCELTMDHCAKNPCENGGTCVQRDTIHCSCPKGFTGGHCQLDVNECGDGPSPCLNGGYCENTHGGFRCICLVGYAGRDCATQVNHCAGGPCRNGGTCIPSRGPQTLEGPNLGLSPNEPVGFTCACAFGFSGPLCKQGSYGFDELSYVQLPPLDPHENEIVFELSTVAHNALLLLTYNEAGAQTSGDYMALDLVDGKPRLSAKFQGERRIDMRLPVPINDARWYQISLRHKQHTLSFSVGECHSGELGCRKCVWGDVNCSITVDTGIPQMLILGQSLYVGSVKNFTHLQHRPSEMAHFGFQGCLRNFKMNNRNLRDIQMEMVHVLDRCPRLEEKICSSGNDVCGEDGSCIDKWDEQGCDCNGGFTAKACSDADRWWCMSGDAYLSYKMRPEYSRSLLFTPLTSQVPPTQNSGHDFSQLDASHVGSLQTRGDESEPDRWLMLEFRTTNKDGVLFWAGNGFEEFTLIDVVNGTVRYTMKTKDTSPTSISISDMKPVNDGQWHLVSVASYEKGFKLEFRGDEFGKDARFNAPIHDWLHPDNTELNIGGLSAPMELNGRKLKRFTGCFTKFIVNGELQPLSASRSEKFIGSPVLPFEGRSIFGEGGQGDPCDLPFCSNPSKTSVGSLPPHGLEIGIVGVSIFFVIIIAIVLLAYFVFRKWSDGKSRHQQLRTSSRRSNKPVTATIHNIFHTTLAAQKPDTGDQRNNFGSKNVHDQHQHLQTLPQPPSSISVGSYGTTPDLDAPPVPTEAGMTRLSMNYGLSQENRLSGNGPDFEAYAASVFENAAAYRPGRQPMPLRTGGSSGGARISESLEFLHASRIGSQVNTSASGNETGVQFRKQSYHIPSNGAMAQRLHVGLGAYRNELDPTQEEGTPQRYDLDNASSIAPSDVDVSYHYRAYRGSTNQPATHNYQQSLRPTIANNCGQNQPAKSISQSHESHGYENIFPTRSNDSIPSDPAMPSSSVSSNFASKPRSRSSKRQQNINTNNMNNNNTVNNNNNEMYHTEVPLSIASLTNSNPMVSRKSTRRSHKNRRHSSRESARHCQGQASVSGSNSGSDTSDVDQRNTPRSETGPASSTGIGQSSASSRRHRRRSRRKSLKATDRQTDRNGPNHMGYAQSQASVNTAQTMLFDDSLDSINGDPRPQENNYSILEPPDLDLDRVGTSGPPLTIANAQFRPISSDSEFSNTNILSSTPIAKPERRGPKLPHHHHYSNQAYQQPENHRFVELRGQPPLQRELFPPADFRNSGSRNKAAQNSTIQQGVLPISMTGSVLDRNTFASTDDEFGNEPNIGSFRGDTDAIPDLSTFVNRSGELRDLMLGRRMSQTSSSGSRSASTVPIGD